jgi:hypothetical protein
VKFPVLTAIVQVDKVARRLGNHLNICERIIRCDNC